MRALSGDQAAALRSVLERLAPELRTRVEVVADQAAAAAVAAAAHWSFERPAEAVEATIGPDAPAALRRGLIARWASELPVRLPGLQLPAEVLALYPAAVDRLAAFLLAPSDDGYDRDHWVKDLRFVLGLTVPCGAQVVDLSARLGPGELVRGVLGSKNAGASVSYLAARGWGAWLQIHTESRHLEDFNPVGWDETWLRVAALLRARPEARGVLGASWFYDPPLKAVSPRLAYLQDRPVEAGAFLLLQGPDALSTERAVATSPTRRRLVEEGLYQPRSWIMAWPRAALLRWAADHDRARLAA